MNSSISVPYICSNSPIDFELQNQGRVLLIKDALYDPSTKKYHDIKLVRNGWKLFGFDLGGGGEFTGITEDVVRQIQSTYGIVLKTLKSKPNDAVFWGDEQKTSYITALDAAKTYPSKWRVLGNVKVSYPLGKKEGDLLLLKEDSARFGADQMTLHDAIHKGIWNADGWIQGKSRSSGKDKDSIREAVTQNSNATDQKKLGEKSKKALTQKSRNASQKSLNQPDRSEIDSGRQSNGKQTKAALSPKEEEVSLTNSNQLHKGSRSKGRSELAESNDGSVSGRSPIDKRASLGSIEDGMEDLIDTFPSIPVYRANSTPIEFGYDDAPFEERKKRIIAHLDNVSPIPFSALVDQNLEQRIHPLLFQRMLASLRRLAENPEANDADAKYMKELFKHWFRAAYHYLDRNSKPGDGYQQVLSEVSEKTKNVEQAEKRAKEIYWRRHATDFWMTLVDLFASEKIGIDLFHKSLSSKTSLNFWF